MKTVYKYLHMFSLLKERLKGVIIIVLLLFVVGVQAQSELNNYLKIAAENNPGLKSKFSAYMVSMQKISQVGSLPDPQVAFGYFITPVETRVGPQQFKVSLSQMFPWFGLLGAKKDVATQMANVKYEVFEQYKSKLFYEVKAMYYNLYLINKSIAITNENIEILKTLQQITIVKFESGKAEIVDELRVEMEINDLENQLANLRDSKWVMKVQFNNLLNDTNSVIIVLPDSLWGESLTINREALLDSIAVQNHTIKQIEHRILSWQRQEKVAQKMGKPNIMLGVDYVAIGTSDNPMLDASENGKDAIIFPKISLSIPIYRKKYSAMIKEVAFSLEGENYQKEERINQLSNLFEKGFKEYNDAERRIQLFRKQSRLAKQSLHLLITSYSTHGKNFEEVLRMERKVLKYKLELDKARADKNAAVAFIDYLRGK